MASGIASRTPATSLGSRLAANDTARTQLAANGNAAVGLRLVPVTVFARPDTVGVAQPGNLQAQPVRRIETGAALPLPPLTTPVAKASSSQPTAQNNPALLQHAGQVSDAPPGKSALDCSASCAQVLTAKLTDSDAVAPTAAELELIRKVEAEAISKPQSWSENLSHLWSAALSQFGLGETVASAPTDDPIAEKLAKLDEPQGIEAYQPRRATAWLPEASGNPAATSEPVAVRVLKLDTNSLTAAPQRASVAFTEQMATDGAFAADASLITGEVRDEPTRPELDLQDSLAGAVAAVEETDRLQMPQSPIAPYGNTPNSYDVRGYTLKVLPKLTDRAMADCAIALAESDDGRFTIITRGGTAKVTVETDRRPPEPVSDAKPGKSAKAKIKTVKALPEVTTETVTQPDAISAVFRVMGRNRPTLEVSFPNGHPALISGSRLPFGVVCRYELEIRPPDCRVATISRRSLHPMLGFTVETNTVGKCQLTRNVR